MLHSDCAKLDPRIRRTRKLLQDALRKLLAEKEFDKISVQDITEAATLNRATFYAHYADKFALLGELIRVSFLELLAQRDVQFDGGCSTAFQVIILAVCDYLTELQATHSSNQHQFEPFVEATLSLKVTRTDPALDEEPVATSPSDTLPATSTRSSTAVVMPEPVGRTAIPLPPLSETTVFDTESQLDPFG